MPDEIDSIRSLILFMKAWVKILHLLDTVKVELVYNHTSLPTLDIDTRWSSTFVMIKNSYKERLIFNSAYHRVPKLQDILVIDEEWAKSS